MHQTTPYNCWQWLIGLLLLVMSYSATALDRLEQQLDQLLAATLTDQQLRQQLFDLAASNDTTAPSPGLVRLYGYVALEHAYMNEPQQAQHYLQKMEQLALTLNTADAIAEWKSSVLEYLLFTGDLALAEPLIDDLLLVLNDAQSGRIRYYGYIIVARLLKQLERPQQALNNLQLSLTAVLETDNSRTEIRRLNLLMEIAQLQFTVNHFDAAEATVSELVTQLQPSNLDYLFSDRAQLLLAAIESQTNRPEAALARLQRLQKDLVQAPELRNQQIYASALNYLLAIYLDQRDYPAAASIIDTMGQPQQSIEASRDSALLDLQQAIVAAGMLPTEDNLAELQQRFANPPLMTQETQLAVLGWYSDILRHNHLIDDYAAVIEQIDNIREQLFRQRLQTNTSEIEAIYLLTDKQHQIHLLRRQSALDQQLLETQSQRRQLAQWITIIAIAVIMLLAWLLRTLHNSHRALDQLNQKLFHQSMHDPMTGLLNRRALATQLEQLTPDLHQRGGLILIDIDHFKRINDTLGHQAGDQVLIEVAQRLQQQAISSDLLVRWGGEEFVIFVPKLGERNLQAMVEHLLASIATPSFQLTAAEPLLVTISAGVVPLPMVDSSGNILSWEQCLQLADHLLYASKTYGRHQAWLAEQLNQPFHQVLLAIEEDIEVAQQSQQIELRLIQGKRSELPH